MSAAPVPAARRARTRTGCKTCRQRKLKCDEVKPICGHCRKSNRECQPSEGVAFRHAQNAGFGEQDGGNELGNFYKYRQKFANTYFLPIPQELSFVHVTDPYEDDANPATTSHQPTPSQKQTLQYQQHQHQHQHQHQQHVQSGLSSSSSQYQPPQYVDVAATSLKVMIDPNLEAGTDGGGNGGNIGLGNTGHGQDGMGTVGGENSMTEAETLNETILNALKQSEGAMR